MCEHAPNAQILQYFYSILSSQFTLLPSLMPVFANKLGELGNAITLSQYQVSHDLISVSYILLIQVLESLIL